MLLKFRFSVLFLYQIFVCLSGSHALDTRNITTKFLCNEDSEGHASNGSFNNLAYSRAEGVTDTLHYLFSSVGIPGILVAKTSHAAKLAVNCHHFLSQNISEFGQSIRFSEQAPHYVFSLLFSELLEYNDIDDSANISHVHPDNSTRLYHLSQLPWTDSSAISDIQSNTVYLKVQDSQGSFHLQDNGSLSFKIQVTGDTERSLVLPHLQGTPNGAEVDFTLDHIKASFSNSRFAVAMILITSQPSQAMHLNSTTTIDDEYSPGVFETIDWTASNDNGSTAAYLQWKPVCYRQRHRSVGVATRAKHYQLEQTEFTGPANTSIAYAYFGHALYGGDLTIRATNISFGLTDDNFYINSNFTAWTFVLGIGQPPSDKVSLLIILVISIGLGIPTVLIIFGGLGVCIKRYKEDKKDKSEFTSSYTRIN